MAGIYVHIPFCKKRCIYCDFFSTTLLEKRDEYIQALLQEIAERKNETGEPLRTIYIGGGTPSVLTPEHIHSILQAIGTQDAIEITMEMNPADISLKYLQSIRATGVNRLSIGIQSFQDELLKFLGRRHSAAQAMEAVCTAQEAGFANISIDLMYAIPSQTKAQWLSDIDIALSLNVQHISSYGLMYEEDTALTRLRDAKQITPIDEDLENELYDTLCQRLQQAGFVHYEVSNFALPGYESKHNSSYWNNTPYVGVGAGAHSYITNTHTNANDPLSATNDPRNNTQPVRSWNPDDLNAYINGILAHNLLRESETLTPRDQYNERIMLGLRTSQGIHLSDTNATRERDEVILDFTRYNQLLITQDDRVVVTQKGLHILNRIIEKLMI